MPSYDQSLLEEVPQATRAQLQEGYNVDLLEHQLPRRTSSVRNSTSHIPPVPPQTPHPDITESVPEEKFSSPTHTSDAPKPKRSFWRSRNGIITIVVIVVVIVAAVVGGAVGGSVGKNNSTKTATATKTGSSPEATSNSPSITSSTSSSLAPSASQGIGGQASASAAGSIPSVGGSNIQTQAV